MSISIIIVTHVAYSKIPNNFRNPTLSLTTTEIPLYKII